MITVSAKVKARQIAAYDKKLAKNMGKPLAKRGERGVLAASQRVLVPRVKAEIRTHKGKNLHYDHKAGGYRKSGNMARLVRSKLLRQRGGEFIRPTWTGSKAFYVPMVTGGTKPHFLSRRGAEWVAFGPGEVVRANSFVHPGSRPWPVIDRAAEDALPDVITLIRKDIFTTR
jgi:hypothetical protein